jgi:hypothetical protein
LRIKKVKYVIIQIIIIINSEIDQKKNNHSSQINISKR